MKILLTLTLLGTLFLAAQVSFAGHSIIVEMEGTAQMETGTSKQDTYRAAILDAKRNATEHAVSFIKSETTVKNFQLEKDLVDAYSMAKVVVLGNVLEKEWYVDPVMGKTCKVRVKLEVTPLDETMGTGGNGDDTMHNPSAPLVVKAWTDKATYKEGDKIKVYVQGNKPYYVKLVYRDAEGDLLQLLPNPYRKENYFNGGVICEIPSGNDRFELEVTPPFGAEKVLVYTSTSPLGDMDLTDAESVYQVNESEQSAAMKTRGVKIARKPSKQSNKQDRTAEFYETSVTIDINL